MIKIASSHSHPAGSTVALVNLCNQLNSRGYSSVLYGPDNWHVGKCASGLLRDFKPEAGDIVILHNIDLKSLSELNNLSLILSGKGRRNLLHGLGRVISSRFSPSSPPDKFKLFLTCQEENAGCGIAMRHSLFNKIHFVSAAQKGFNTKCHKFVCPNFLTYLSPSEGKPEKMAGIIGSIDRKNDTKAIIEKALQDGMETVILYGYLADPIYYYSAIAPLVKLHRGKIKFAGFVEDQQKMYDSISDAYVAVSRPWSMVRHECAITQTRFHGPETQVDTNISNDQIFEVWKRELEL